MSVFDRVPPPRRIQVHRKTAYVSPLWRSFENIQFIAGSVEFILVEFMFAFTCKYCQRCDDIIDNKVVLKPVALILALGTRALQ